MVHESFRVADIRCPFSAAPKPRCLGGHDTLSCGSFAAVCRARRGLIQVLTTLTPFDRCRGSAGTRVVRWGCNCMPPVPENRQTRKPWFLLRLSGLLLLRYAERQFLAELFQLPPRITRWALLRVPRRPGDFAGLRPDRADSIEQLYANSHRPQLNHGQIRTLPTTKNFVPSLRSGRV